MSISDRQLLSVKRFHQHTGECAICAVSSIAHFYDKTITYAKVRRMVDKNERKDGLYLICD